MLKNNPNSEIKKKFFDRNIIITKNYYDQHILEKKSWFGDVPPFSNLEINITDLCNRKCSFCPKSNRKLFPNRKKFLTESFYQKILEELSFLHFKGRISFCGLSEPLMHNNLNSLITLTKKYCPDCFLDILTNGDFLTVSNAKIFFKSGLDNIKISMYDGPHQISLFNEIKAKLLLTDEQFIIRKRYLSSNKNFGLTINNRGGSVNLQEYGITPLKEPLKRSCYYPFHKLIIDHNGDVMICPCDWQKKLIVGNLNKKSLLEIWNSELLTKVRKRLIEKDRTFPPCQECDVNGTLYAQLHFQAWRLYYGEINNYD